MSSGYSTSLLTWIGRGSATERISRSSTASSISPVGSLGFTAAGARATTVPVTVTTLSRRSPSAVLKCGLERSNTRSEEHTSELQSLAYLVCRLLLEKKNTLQTANHVGASTCDNPSRLRPTINVEAVSG